MDFPLFLNNCHWIQLSWHQEIYSVRAWSAIWNGNACSFYTCETKKKSDPLCFGGKNVRVRSCSCACVSFNTYKITKINWLRTCCSEDIDQYNKTSSIFSWSWRERRKENRKNKENQSAVDKPPFKADQEKKSFFADCFIS